MKQFKDSLFNEGWPFSFSIIKLIHFSLSITKLCYEWFNSSNYIFNFIYPITNSYVLFLISLLLISKKMCSPCVPSFTILLMGYLTNTCKPEIYEPCRGLSCPWKLYLGKLNGSIRSIFHHSEHKCFVIANRTLGTMVVIFCITPFAYEPWNYLWMYYQYLWRK